MVYESSTVFRFSDFQITETKDGELFIDVGEKSIKLDDETAKDIMAIFKKNLQRKGVALRKRRKHSEDKSKEVTKTIADTLTKPKG